MDAIEFLFRGKLYRCDAFLDAFELPCFVFVILRDHELVEEFGEEVSLKTDLQSLLVRRDDYQALVELRTAIFSVIKNTTTFQEAREKSSQHPHSS